MNLVHPEDQEGTMSGDELEPESLFILRLPPVSKCTGIDDLVILQFCSCIRHAYCLEEVFQHVELVLHTLHD